ncbi:MAG: hypothetical protein K0R75_1452 [Paenibacillaceae bacterium]|jgi:hypothetical protein|nr:hypothetical protein [Paenibacillaceae bacterium]
MTFSHFYNNKVSQIRWQSKKVDLTPNNVAQFSFFH